MTVFKPWRHDYDCEITGDEALYAAMAGKPVDANVGELIRRATACQRKFSRMDKTRRSWAYFESMRRLANTAATYGHMASIRIEA